MAELECHETQKQPLMAMMSPIVRSQCGAQLWSGFAIVAVQAGIAAFPLSRCNSGARPIHSSLAVILHRDERVPGHEPEKHEESIVCARPDSGTECQNLGLL